MKFTFSGTMLRFVEYAKEVEISEPTFQRALEALVSRNPQLQSVLLDGEGNLRRTHQMFLNGQSMDPRYYADTQARGELAMQPDDSVYILTAIAGG
jgi:sulfur-carrier protein